MATGKSQTSQWQEYNRTLTAQQIQLFVTPFHRMFSLDNRSIQYPFAVHERVPVCKSIQQHGMALLILTTSYSMGCCLGRLYSFPDHPRLVRNVSSRCAKDASNGTRAIRGFDADLTPNGYNKKCGWEATSGLVVALQTLPRHIKQCADRMDRLHRNQPAHSTGGMAELP